MGWLLLAWVGQLALFDGIGRLVLRAGRLGPLPRLPAVAFWVGFAAVALALAALHFAVAIDGRVLAALAALAAAGHVLGRHDWWAALQRADRFDVASAVLIAAFAVLLAQRALAVPDNPDSASYHLQAIVWSHGWPLTPGLGNLTPQLGHNQGYFLYAAAMNSGPFDALKYHSTNGPIALAAFASCAHGVLIAARGNARPAALVAALLLGAVVLQSILRVNNPSPDLCVFLVGFALGLWFVAVVEAPVRAEAVAVVLLGAAAVSLKLALVGLAVPICATIWWRAGRPRAPIAIAAGAFAVTLGRAAVLTGYPFYPSTVVGLPVDWRMPKQQVDAVFDVIRAWGRRPGHGIDGVLDSSGWVGPWFESAWLSNMDFLLPAVVGLIAVIALVVRRPPGTWTLGPAAAGLVFWWALSPDIRFAGAGLWLFTAQAVVLLSGDGFRAGRAWSAVSLAVLAGAVLAQPVLSRAEGLEPLPPPTQRTFTTRSGLVLKLGDQEPCWDVAPPCAAAGEASLVERKPGDLGAGFRLEGPPTIDWRRGWNRPRW